MWVTSRTGRNGTTYRGHWTDPTHGTSVHCSKGGFTSRRDAARYAADQEAKIRDGTSLNPQTSRMTVAQLIALWEAGTTVAASTQGRRNSPTRTHLVPEFGHRLVRSLKPSELRVFVKSLRDQGYAPWTIHDIMQVLRQALDLAVADKIIGSNPAKGLRLPPQQRVRPRPALTARQAQLLAAAFEDHWQPMLQAGFGTGMRYQELIGVRRREVDLLHRRVRVVAGDPLSRVGGRLVRSPGKTLAAARTIELDAATLAAFAAALERPGGPDDSVFRGKRGTLLHQATFNEVWAQTLAVLRERLTKLLDPDAADDAWLVKLTTVPDRRGKLEMSAKRLAGWRARIDVLVAGVAADEAVALLAKLPDLVPHCMRHTHATWLVGLGTDPATLMARMGWASWRSAQPYMQPEDGAARRAAAAIGERMATVAAAAPSSAPAAGGNVTRLPAVGG